MSRLLPFDLPPDNALPEAWLKATDELKDHRFFVHCHIPKLVPTENGLEPIEEHDAYARWGAAYTAGYLRTVHFFPGRPHAVSLSRSDAWHMYLHHMIRVDNIKFIRFANARTAKQFPSRYLWHEQYPNELFPREDKINENR